jgi:outer membrane protein insertion porin family
MTTTSFYPYKKILQVSGVVCILLLSSCGVVPKDYPRNKPFVFKYNVEVEGNGTPLEKTELGANLSKQLDDSIKVRTARRLLYRGVNRPVLDKPPVYDSVNADKSVIYMKALLRSLGYFRDTITYKAFIDTVEGDQYRTTVNFKVTPGKVVRIDSFRYNIKQEALQSITVAHQNESLLKKGAPFAKAAVSQDLDRLVNLYRDNGYMRFSREALIGLWDTLDVSLLKPTFDPFEEIENLQKIKERQENPTANLEIRLKPGFDSSKLKKYYIGNVTIYPDYTLDTGSYTRKEKIVDGLKVVYYQNIFKPGIFPQNISLRHGELYDQRNYFKTINRFNSIGSWRLVNIDQPPRGDQDTTDIIIRLTPARKYSFTSNIEGSRNQNALSGNLFGIAINVGLQNRNFARAANQASTNIRFGIETGRDTVTNVKFIQTRQLSIGHTIFFPRAIIPFGKRIPEKVRNTFRTILSVNGTLTDRRGLYNLNTISGSWGYEFQVRKMFFTTRLYNIEYSSFKAQAKLLEIFNNNPSLRNVFTDGFIESISGGMTVLGGKGKNVNNFRLNIEKSGLLTPLIKHNRFLDTNLLRFLKIDADFARKIVFRKSALVLHAFAGVGYEFNSTVNEKRRNSLPFYRQYFAGGPTSMRAWALRKLGRGSSVKSFGTGASGLPDRFGDVQLEGNIEYRFPLAIIAGTKVDGALFTDIGNVWLLKKGAGDPEEIFKLGRLGTDLGVGSGVGIRVDFNFFVVRLDVSHKVKDPSPDPSRAYLQNKWFGYVQKDFFKGTQFQLGISYPFIL